MRVLARSAMFLGIVLSFTVPARAQSAVGVDLDEVVDNRISAGPWSGSLELRVKLRGLGLEKATAARVIVKEARDDVGTLLAEKPSIPDFMPRDYNSGLLQFTVRTPPRSARSVKVKGTVELFVPGRDPNSIVKIDKALSKLDVPLASKALKAAKIEITPLSRAGYAEAQKKRKLNETQIAAIRAEGKKQGVSEAEIEMAIEMAKAFENIDAELPENAVFLSGKKSDFDRLFRVEVLGSDGKPMNVTMRSVSSRGDWAVMTLQPSEAPPQNVALQIFLVTDKSRMSFPFDLNVSLP
jgi:hypothetical protein